MSATVSNEKGEAPLEPPSKRTRSVSEQVEERNAAEQGAESSRSIVAAGSGKRKSEELEESEALSERQSKRRSTVS